MTVELLKCPLLLCNSKGHEVLFFRNKSKLHLSMFIQEIKTIQVKRLCDLYLGRQITDDCGEMVRIINAFGADELIPQDHHHKDELGNTRIYSFLVGFRKVYESNGKCYVEFEVWSAVTIPEEWISLRELIQHYLPVYCWLY